jgi:hypothetical protein
MARIAVVLVPDDAFLSEVRCIGDKIALVVRSGHAGARFVDASGDRNLVEEEGRDGIRGSTLLVEAHCHGESLVTTVWGARIADWKNNTQEKNNGNKRNIKDKKEKNSDEE